MNLNKRKLRLLRNYVIWRRAGSVFVHVPKAAGTSMSHALYGRTLGHYSVAELRDTFPNLMNSTVVFAICRSPYARVVSAYEFARLGSTGVMGVERPEQYKTPEFDSFDTFVQNWLPFQDMGLIDGIFRPQWSFVSQGGSLAVDFLLRAEELGENLTSLEQRLGRNIALTHMNSSGRRSKLDTYYSEPSTKRLVKEIYAQDFTMFGYDD